MVLHRESQAALSVRPSRSAESTAAIVSSSGWQYAISTRTSRTSRITRLRPPSATQWITASRGSSRSRALSGRLNRDACSGTATCNRGWFRTLRPSNRPACAHVSCPPTRTASWSGTGRSGAAYQPCRTRMISPRATARESCRLDHPSASSSWVAATSRRRTSSRRDIPAACRACAGALAPATRSVDYCRPGVKCRRRGGSRECASANLADPGFRSPAFHTGGERQEGETGRLRRAGPSSVRRPCRCAAAPRRRR